MMYSNGHTARYRGKGQPMAPTPFRRRARPGLAGLGPQTLPCAALSCKAGAANQFSSYTVVYLGDI